MGTAQDLARQDTRAQRHPGCFACWLLRHVPARHAGRQMPAPASGGCGCWLSLLGNPKESR
jgi:hypothetical protein